MASYLLQENGDRLLLEDSSGAVLLETDGAAFVYLRPIAPILAARRRRCRRMWWLPFLLTFFA